MKTILLTFSFACLLSLPAFAQGGISVNTTGTAPDNSAMLDVQSTTKGILIPRMTQAQRTAIASPATGLMVYQTNNTTGFYYYNGSAWASIGAGSFTETDPKVATTTTGRLARWNGTALADGLLFDNGTNIGLGTASPADKLHVVGKLRIDAGKIDFRNTGESVFIGQDAGLNDDLTNNQNVFVGFEAGKANTTGNLNTFMGHASGMTNTTGRWNTSLGQFALGSNTTGNWNTALGRASLAANTTGSENVAVGEGTLTKNTTGNQNTAVGDNAFYNSTNISNSVALGYQAGYNNLTGSGNVFLGYQAGQNETGSNKLYIANSNTASPLIFGDFATNLLRINGTLNVNNAYSLPTVAGTANQYLQTNGAGVTSWVTPSFLSTETDPKVGTLTTNYLPKWNGTSLANGLLFDNGTNVGLGTASPADKLHVVGKLRIDAGKLDFQNTGRSIFIGTNAGNADDLSTNQNVYVGYDAGAIGTTASDNTAIGYRTLNNNVLGIRNTTIGFQAGFGATGSSNVFLGAFAGFSETGSDKLYIDNSNTVNPLIYGDFGTDLLRINGTLNVNNAYSLPTVAGTANQYLQTNGAGVTSWVTPSFLSTETDPKVGTLTTNYLPKWNGTSLANGLLFDDGTNVGLGTASPTEKLEVVGNTKTIKLFANDFISAGATLSPTTLSPIAIFNSTGNAPVFVGEATNNKGVMFGYTGNDIQGRSGVNFINNDHLILNQFGGNVGVGTTSPTEKLDVAGKTKTDNLQMTTGATNGYVLQSDASGNGTWVNPTALPITESDPKVGTLTTNYLPKWNGISLANGTMFDDGTNVGLGTASPADKLHVVGKLRIDAGKIDFRNTGESVFIGESAGANDDLTNNQNVFIGKDAGSANTTGNLNTFVGHASGTTNSTGIWNTGIGQNALGANTTGNYNTGLGRSALGNNTTGSYNTVLGQNALATNTIGSNNIAVGQTALGLATNADKSIAIGVGALGNSTNSIQNIAIGHQAGNNNLTGSDNIFLGFNAGYSETGSNKLYIDNSNTASPLLYGEFDNNFLRVNGTLNINNAYNLPTVAGSANQFLQTNGAGVTSWVTPSFLSTESDPKVGTLTTNYMPKWNGTSLANGKIYDDGTNVGVSIIPTHTFQVGMGYETSSTATVSQTVGGTYFGDNLSTWQSFTSTCNCSLEKIALGFYSIPVSNNRTISIYQGEGTSGTLLFTSAATTIPLGSNWVDFSTSGVILTTGQQYTFVLSNRENWLLANYNPYAGGRASVNASYDFRFIVYAFAQKTGFAVNNSGVSINNYTLPVADGTANQYLQTNGAGVASWVTPSFLSTESDPKVGTLTTNYLPKWNGTSLANGLLFDNGTNVGLGTTSPTEKLEVVGKTKTNNLQMTTGATNGYVLQSDASGNGTWVNSTSLSITESDPKVGTLTTNYLPKWNGTSLANGLLFDNGTNVGIGTVSPADKLHVVGNTRIDAGRLDFRNTGESVFVGQDAGLNDNFTNNNNVAVGFEALKANTDGSFNVGIGYQALTANTLGVNNVALGYRAGKSIIGSDNNVFIGTNAGTSNTSDGNVFIGNNAGLTNSTGSNNVFIGNNVGTAETGSNKLYIDNSNTSTPLIWGDFTSNYVNINGNLGIGTNTPSTKLHVSNGDARLDRGTNTAGIGRILTINGARSGQGSSFAQLNFENYDNNNGLVDYVGASIGSQNTGSIDAGDLRFSTNNGTLTERMIISKDGYVGIGTSSPTQATLVVNGSQNFTTAYGYLNNAGATGTLSSTTNAYSIYASARIAASEFNAYSDARIKKIKGLSNSSKDLATLANIKITDYTHIDSIAKGNKEVKKVIAQELKTVYPQAVSTMTDVVPDIYQQASINNEGFVSLPTNLKAGEKVKIIFATGEEILEVTEVQETGFRVNSDKAGKVFVYGRQVNDFHVVDYEALSTLNISATQALLKKIEALERQVNTLQIENAKITDLEKQIKEIQASLNQQVKR